MDELTGLLNFLSWPVEVVNFLRAQLAALNVQIPGVLAQLLAAGVLCLVIWYLVSDAREPQRSLKRLGARSVIAASVIGVLSIVIAWGDNLIAPRSHQIVGHVKAPDSARAELDLLDYQSESLGASTDVDSHGAFIVNYSPLFADPPSALKVRVPGCEERRQLLKRTHLLGAPLTVQMSCGGDGG